MIKWCLPQVACKQITQRCCLTKEIILPKLLFSLCFCLHAPKCNDLAKQWGNVMFILTPHNVFCLGNFLTNLEIKVTFRKDGLLRFLPWKAPRWHLNEWKATWKFLCLSSETNVTPWPSLRSRDFLPFCLCLCGLNKGLQLWCITANILVYIVLFGNWNIFPNRTGNSCMKSILQTDSLCWCWTFFNFPKTFLPTLYNTAHDMQGIQ